MNVDFTYNAEVLKIHDGDTITCNVDLGFSVKVVMTFRLKGIDTPELIGVNRQKALDARDFLKSKLTKNIIIKTYKDQREKYGRYLCEIFIGKISINQLMIKEGYAIAYDGGKKTIK